MSINLSYKEKEILSVDLAKFLNELHAITNVPGPTPGQHNWWRGDHISVYEKGALAQIEQLSGIIDNTQALMLWNKASSTKFSKPSVWVHGDIAIGNLIMDKGKLTAVIDFGGAAVGDPACDLSIAWTFFSERSRELFFENIELDSEAWLRAREWTLWKATYELCQIQDKNSSEAHLQIEIIEQVIQV